MLLLLEVLSADAGSFVAIAHAIFSETSAESNLHTYLCMFLCYIFIMYLVRCNIRLRTSTYYLSIMFGRTRVARISTAFFLFFSIRLWLSSLVTLIAVLALRSEDVRRQHSHPLTDSNFVWTSLDFTRQQTTTSMCYRSVEPSGLHP